MYKLQFIIQFRTINYKKVDKLIISFWSKTIYNKKGVNKQIIMIFNQIAKCFE